MNKLLLLLLCVSLILSCGESSTKGKWSTSDLEKCKSEFKKGALQGEDESGQNIIDMYGKTAEEITSCMCEQLMIMYSSLDEAQYQLSEKGLDEMLDSCLSINISSD